MKCLMKRLTKKMKSEREKEHLNYKARKHYRQRKRSDQSLRDAGEKAGNQP